jgi:cell division protein DivIC
MLRFRFINKVPAIFRNKYILTILIFVVWVFLLDSNNLISRFQDMRELHRLNEDREYLQNKVEVDKKKINELKTDNHNLEKFGREQYLMKKPDEDLFIVLTPSEDRKITRKNN